MEINKITFTNIILDNLNNSTSDNGKVDLQHFIDLTNKTYEAITVTPCCKSDSEQLHTEVFKLANKLAINGYGNEAVKMHGICNGM